MFPLERRESWQLEKRPRQMRLRCCGIQRPPRPRRRQQPVTWHSAKGRNRRWYARRNLGVTVKVLPVLSALLGHFVHRFPLRPILGPHSSILARSIRVYDGHTENTPPCRPSNAILGSTSRSTLPSSSRWTGCSRFASRTAHSLSRNCWKSGHTKSRPAGNETLKVERRAPWPALTPLGKTP